MSIYSLMHQHGLCIPDADKWRSCPPLRGEIRGLPGSRGRLLCTNGILCLIERPFIGDLFEGHLDFFVPDREEARRFIALRDTVVPRKKQNLDEHYDV